MLFLFLLKFTLLDLFIVFITAHRKASALPSAKQHPSYGDCLEVTREYFHSPRHTYMSSSYRSNRFGLSHLVPYAVRRGGCLELYYCNMVEWFWWDSSLMSTANWFPLVLWHCWFGHLACKNRPQNDLLCVEWDVKSSTLTAKLALQVLYMLWVAYPSVCPSVCLSQCLWYFDTKNGWWGTTLSR